MKSTNDIWLSVIMPTFNGHAYLEQALASIRAQDVEGVEVIAVDDGSTDETLEILEAGSRKLPIRIERRVHTGNWVESANRALELSQGDYISILHQDDYWIPGRLHELRRILSERPDAVAALHPVRLVDEKSRRIGTWSAPLPGYPRSLSSPDLIDRLLVQNSIAIVAPLFRRAVAMQAGGFSPDLWYAADWDFWLKLAKSGSFLYSPIELAAFRVHPTSQSFLGRRNPGEIRRQLEAVFASHTGNASSQRVRETARFSVEVNVFLFGGYRVGERSMGKLRPLGVRLGFRGWRDYLRDSRIMERAMARVRMLLRARSRHPVRLS